jgi:hypothetical protein
VGGVEDKMKKPTVQERMEQFTSEYTNLPKAEERARLTVL